MARSISVLLLGLLLALAQAPTPAFAATPTLPAVLSAAEVQAWREDLDVMRTRMEATHKDLYHHISADRFQAAVDALKARLPTLARHQVIVEIMRIVASVRDGHTAVAPTRDTKIGFHALPIRLYQFEDDLFVRAADQAHSALVGARVERIGASSASAAMEAAAPLIAQDNAMDVKFFAPALLAMPEVLHALGLSDAPDRASFTLSKDGHTQTVELSSLGPVEMMPADTDTSWMPKPGWVDMRDASGSPTPAWLRDPANLFWFEHLPAQRMVYAQINKVGDKSDESFADFSRRLLAFVAEHDVDKLVIDLRLNRGGNGTLLKPLEVGLLKSGIDRPGHLFVLMGRSTWSASQFFLNFAENYTQAVFVGEPSGSRGNIYGDSRKIVLPNSGITVRASVYYWQDWMPWDTRPWTAPTVAAPLLSSDYRRNVDPALQSVIDYVPEVPLLDTLQRALDGQGIEAALTAYQQYKSQPVHRYAYTEETVLIVGQGLLEKRPAEALRLFQVNARDYPDSYRAWYALGAAQLATGDKPAAIISLERAVAMNPKDYELAQLLAEARKP